MSSNRFRRVDRRSAERLLRGEAVEPQTGLDPLADLLAAAAATTRDGELAGERAAVSAFRAAHPGPVTQPRRPSVLGTLLAKLLTVKLAATALAVGTVGGVAVASVTGVLPPVPGISPAGPPTSSQQPPEPSEPPDGSAPDRDDREGKSADSRTGEHGGPASPALRGLCRAYLTEVGSNPGKALDSPPFRALITAAGGKERVSAYCDTVLDDATPAAHGEGPRPDPAVDIPAGPEQRSSGAGGGSAPGTPTHPDRPAPPSPQPEPPVSDAGGGPAPAPVPPAPPAPPAPHPDR